MESISTTHLLRLLCITSSALLLRSFSAWHDCPLLSTLRICKSIEILQSSWGYRPLSRLCRSISQALSRFLWGMQWTVLYTCLDSSAWASTKSWCPLIPFVCFEMLQRSKKSSSSFHFLTVSFSMFGIESALHHLGKLAPGTTALGCQMAYWHSIHSSLSSKTVLYTRQLFEDQKLMNDTSYLDQSYMDTLLIDFHRLFSLYFHSSPDHSIRFSPRYQSGLYTFHSLSYTRRGRSASLYVSVGSAGELSFGEICFFFRYQQNDFFLFRQFQKSNSLVSSLFEMDPEVPGWPETVDNYYSFILFRASVLRIVPCSHIRNKCLYFPFNDELKICTEVEHELEHDWQKLFWNCVVSSILFLFKISFCLI